MAECSPHSLPLPPPLPPCQALVNGRRVPGPGGGFGTLELPPPLSSCRGCWELWLSARCFPTCVLLAGMCLWVLGPLLTCDLCCPLTSADLGGVERSCWGIENGFSFVGYNIAVILFLLLTTVILMGPVFYFLIPSIFTAGLREFFPLYFYI